MKKNFIRNTLILIFALATFSCSNLIEQSLGDSPAQEKTAYIKLSLGSDRVSRTVFPSWDEVRFTDLVLKGAKQGGIEETLGSWASVSDMQNTALPVTTGSWTFTLSAKQGGTVFSGTTTKEITVGENSLSFKLTITSFGTEAGSFDIALIFRDAPNADKVTKAIATLENLDGSAVPGIVSQNLTPVGNEVVIFRASGIAAGIYRAKVAFYATEGSTDFELATWRELVQISSSLTSTANRTIESFDNLYTITYSLNGGTLADGATLQETVTRKSAAITLPALTRNYYTFDGWFTTENFADGTEVTALENFTDDIAVYAKFTPITYTITYVLNGGTNADGALTTYTMDDDVTLPTPTKAGSAFKGWYKIDDFSDSKLTGWNKGKLHENITLYARWNAYLEVTRELAKFKIKELTSNTTVKVKDSDSYGLSLSDINAALKELATTNSDVLVTLDISGFEIKKIVMDSDKENFKDCTNLEEVIFPKNVSKFDTFYGFGGCTSLESITIPNGIKTIESGAFYNCTSLKSVVIPSSVTKIYCPAFGNCSSIESIIFKYPDKWIRKNLKGEIYGGYFNFNYPTDSNIRYMTDPLYIKDSTHNYYYSWVKN